MSKILELLVTPSDVIGLLIVLALVALILRLFRTAAIVGVLAGVMFVVLAWSPVSRLALQILENRFPSVGEPLHDPVTGFIMIGGAVDVHLSYSRGTPSLNAAAERITALAEVMREFPEARVILSGGGSQITATGRMTEASVARDALVALGVSADRLELEQNSQTTCENASESYKLAKPGPDDRWVLITSASQMPRAVGCFRKAGFDIVAYPVDFRTGPSFESALSFSSASEGLEMADLTAHEWFGLISYYSSGKISDLLPGPIDHSVVPPAGSDQP